MFAHVLPHLAMAARWGWRNRRDLMWVYDRLRGHRRPRGRGGYRTGYAKGWSAGMRQNQARRNFGYGGFYGRRQGGYRGRRRR